MSDAQIRDLIGALSRGPAFDSLSIGEMREAFDRIGAMSAAPDNIQFTQLSANGVPIEIGSSAEASEHEAILYFHGGGYTIGSLASHRASVARLGLAAKARTVAVDFRLAPENPYPAALDDALTAYRWLLDQGIESGSIALAGDSAGGGLAAALILRICELGLPKPSTAVMFSPLADLSGTSETLDTKAATDPMVTRPVYDQLCSGYLGGADPTTPHASPVFGDFEGSPPLLIYASTHEMLVDDAVKLTRRAIMANVRVSLQAWPHVPHAWTIFPDILDEAAQALSEAGQWIRTHLA